VNAALARPDAPRPPWSVVCDFDGTIALDDVTDSLLLRFARPGWRELEAAWESGRISARTCMAGQVALLDCSRDELEAHVAGIAIDPAFRAFVAAVHAAGASLTIASDGLDAVIAAMLARVAVPELEVRASRLLQLGPREWGLSFPHARADCTSGAATCKCACLRDDDGGPTLLVGDGASDFCVAGRVELTFAKSALRDHCVDLGLPHRPIADFADALAAWRELVVGAPDTAARPREEIA
jgi:2-hydroxy-3-keto-5-methylthiopentenyl-1-phosphate phosphatase